MKHTALFYQVFYDDDVFIASEDPKHNYDICCMNRRIDLDLRKANAEFIVRACNNHDKFRIACKGAIAALSQNKTFPADIEAARVFLTDALAKATK